VIHVSSGVLHLKKGHGKPSIGLVRGPGRRGKKKKRRKSREQSDRSCRVPYPSLLRPLFSKSSRICGSRTAEQGGKKGEGKKKGEKSMAPEKKEKRKFSSESHSHPSLSPPCLPFFPSPTGNQTYLYLLLERRTGGRKKRKKKKGKKIRARTTCTIRSLFLHSFFLPPLFHPFHFVRKRGKN